MNVLGLLRSAINSTPGINNRSVMERERDRAPYKVCGITAVTADPTGSRFVFRIGYDLLQLQTGARVTIIYQLIVGQSWPKSETCTVRRALATSVVSQASMAVLQLTDTSMPAGGN